MPFLESQLLHLQMLSEACRRSAEENLRGEVAISQVHAVIATWARDVAIIVIFKYHIKRGQRERL